MKCLKILLSVMILAALVASCTKKTASGTESLVPANAKMVVAINMQQFMEKMAKNGFNVDSEEDILKSFEDSTYKPLPAFWKASTTLGVDFAQPAVISITPDENTLNKNRGILQFTFAISNKDSFETYIKKQQKDVVIEKDGINFMNDGDDMLIGYNNRFAVAVQDVNMDEGGGFNRSEASLSQKEKMVKYKDWIKKIMRTSANKSIVSNKQYTALSSKGNDVKIWADQEYVISKMKNDNQGVQLITRLFKGLFKGSSTTTLLNFDNGKVNTLNQMYFSDEAAKVIKASPSQQMDLQLLNAFPGTNLNMLAGVSLTPSLLNDFAKYLKLDGLMNAAFSEIKFSDKEVFEAFTGDVLVAVSDVNSTTNSSNTENMNLGIMMNIKNKASVEKLLTIPDIAKAVKKENDYFVINNGDVSVAAKNKMYLYMNDKVAIISPNQQLAANYIKGTSKNSFSDTALKLFQGKTGGYFYNIASFGEVMNKVNYPDVPMIGNPQFLMKDFMKIFVNTHMTSGQFKGNYFESTGSLTLNNDKVNSLAYMIRSGYNAMLTAKKKEINRPADIDLSDVDSGFEDDEIKPRKVK